MMEGGDQNMHHSNTPVLQLFFLRLVFSQSLPYS
jgi:hypothetical protein